MLQKDSSPKNGSCAIIYLFTHVTPNNVHVTLFPVTQNTQQTQTEQKLNEKSVPANSSRWIRQNEMNVSG